MERALTFMTYSKGSVLGKKGSDKYFFIYKTKYLGMLVFVVKSLYWRAFIMKNPSSTQ
jgi:hypothetical protein